MGIGELLLRGTIWLSLAAWVVAEWRRGRGDARAGRSAWALGALAALAHAVAAFHFRHGWSHQAALAETARQTAAVTGLDWGGGLIVNYVFLGLWASDAAWWWMSAPTFARRPKALDRAVRGFVLFMFVNGAAVFVVGPLRAVGSLAAVAVVLAWYRGRSAGGVEHG